MITVLGSANMDLLARVERLPGAGETVLSTGFLRAPGGKGANQAVAAARAGSTVAFIGKVGADLFGTYLIDNLQAAGVQTQQTTIEEDAPTGMALISVDRHGENCIVVVPGANSAISTSDVVNARAVIARSSVLVAQLEISLDAVLRAALLAKDAGATVILNASPARALTTELLRVVDVLVVNREEIGLVSGMGSPVEPSTAASMLCAAGVGGVIVTLGSEGAVVTTPSGTTDIPSYHVEVVDTTAAGDAFVGNLAHALEKGEPLLQASKYASAAAAWSIGRSGAQPSMPTHLETQQIFEGNRLQ
ncbi:MAG: ribokinase [Chloroflexota bacterium]